MPSHSKITKAKSILSVFGMPKGQINDRTALCLLALLNLKEKTAWSRALSPLIGITPMMDFARIHYGKKYAPNSRETFRRYSMHQLVDAGVALYNPDKPDRPVNSPKAVYQIAPEALALLQLFGSPLWSQRLQEFLNVRQSLASRYAMARDMEKLSVIVSGNKEIRLSPGVHSALIVSIIKEFAPRFAPGSHVAYVGDTGDKWGYFNQKLLASKGVTIDNHGKMPDVVFYDQARDWWLLVEAVTSHGPVDGKRHHELAKLFSELRAKLVFVTAFPSRAIMTRYLEAIAWETEVWCSDAPSHLIHFNGERFLGPYKAKP
jgi:BsuBI/PstI restriction endonuclease domain/BsuBI/PstI restriction endonuclease HTH domain